MWLLSHGVLLKGLCARRPGPQTPTRTPPRGALVSIDVRRRPSLPQRSPCRTIGAERLSFRLLNETGRFPFAMTAVTFSSRAAPTSRLRPIRCQLPVPREPHSGRVAPPAAAGGECGQALGLLVPVSSTPRRASTSGLSTRWSCRGPYQVDPVGDLILKRASRLDAFSGYPCRT